MAPVEAASSDLGGVASVLVGGGLEALVVGADAGDGVGAAHFLLGVVLHVIVVGLVVVVGVVVVVLHVVVVSLVVVVGLVLVVVVLVHWLVVHLFGAIIK